MWLNTASDLEQELTRRTKRCPYMTQDVIIFSRPYATMLRPSLRLSVCRNCL